MISRIIYALPLLVMAYLAIFYTINVMEKSRIVIVDIPAPAFTLPSFTDASDTLSTTELKGEIKIVSFFATWCPSCVVEHRQLTKLSQMKEFKVYGIANKDDPVDLKNLLENYGNPFEKIGFDKEGAIYSLWGVKQMPASYIIDTKGHIRYIHGGIISKSDIENKIMPVIEMLQKETH